MKAPKTYLVLFDLDRTILSTNSGNILVREAYKHKLMTSREFMKAAYLGLCYRLEVRDTMMILEEMAEWMEGIAEKELQALADQVIKRYLINKIRPEIEDELKMHKERGAHIGILSAALAVICHPIASKFEMDEVICSDMEVIDGKYTGKVVGKLCFGEQKIISLKKFCQENDFKLDETYYYADSISDSPVLEAVGYPICVEPDRRLTAMAKKKGWTIADWAC
ncbi:MAG: HAD-IB family hydrolase [Bacteroidetes bacterium]|jgi:putative phosphoserine phosphatase/1-acylglycerol-3-phosphate O-acyltransferase|nr:HAD-IB family hydrolase [Bacteroidota bacterium]MBT7825702.1 HAD-IB family hydrolase [Bacteroidota bacterium]